MSLPLPSAMIIKIPGCQAAIEKISKTNSSCHKYCICTPQMDVIDDQSSDNSSALEALTKLSFPQSKELCTRF
ncbi:hypothetical protein BGZ95_002632 [Linnemannia exigua]|uniref:Uncharacterized protein n=1 Tax=Linnemannia exigua TaxID=604196 RepID=A0AAD4D5A3_9FUNG|nr:hypothetical protein BGZ95_002632 [Linnemannia exigua]